MATTLPSFVQLMASLGLDQPSISENSSSRSSSPSQSPRLESLLASSPTRSKSSPSLRDLTLSRPRVARYSPYSPVLSYTRRGSLSSVSSGSSQDSDYSPSHHSFSFSSGSSSTLRGRRSGNNLSINIYDSTTDLQANTPISSYLRRKTPGTSPTSPTFPRDSDTSPTSLPMPLSIPILPTLLPHSANSDSFPETPNSDISGRYSPKHLDKPKSLEAGLYTRHIRRYTGVRISTPPRSADCGESYSRRRPFIV